MSGFQFRFLTLEEIVQRQRLRNAAMSAEVESIADRFPWRNPAGVDNQGDAQVVEPLALPPPEQGKG
jgi:hypothetical protein